MPNDPTNFFEGLRQAGRPLKQEPLEATKSVIVYHWPEWVHNEYRMLKAQAEPGTLMNDLYVEALREYLPLAFAKRGLRYHGRVTAKEGEDNG